MNRSSIILLLIAAIVGGGLYYYYRVPPKMSLAKLSLTHLDGSAVDASFFKEKTVLLSFYKSWCGPCMGEMHSFQAISKEFKNELVVVCISDEEMPLQKRVAERFSEGDLYFLSTTKQFDELGIHTFPTNFILSKNGKVLYEKTAAEEWDSEPIKSKLKAWIAK